MKLNTLAAAIAVAATSFVAVPAVAQSVSPGEAQLAYSVGVEPGTLSLSQLIQLDQAQREGGASGTATAAWILKSANGQGYTAGSDRVSRELPRGNTSLGGAVNQGNAQLAASLGVNPADYTTSELVELAVQDNLNKED